MSPARAGSLAATLRWSASAAWSDDAMNAAAIPALTLPAFSQLLEPAGLAPALDFSTTGQLVYTEVPSVEFRAKVRFVISDDVTFRPGTPEEVARLIKHWRAE